ncbi:MAG TPA: hypothetical protein VLI55_13330 [Bryobacteraceae bacterium]|nr:hypothetical protein [Bryobacteraceae bacterium]
MQHTAALADEEFRRFLLQSLLVDPGASGPVSSISSARTCRTKAKYQRVVVAKYRTSCPDFRVSSALMMVSGEAHEAQGVIDN